MSHRHISEEIELITTNLAHAREIATTEIKYLNERYLNNIIGTLRKSSDDEGIGSKITSAIERKNQLTDLIDVPYFTELISTSESGIIKSIRIGKFSCTEASIYSWTAPIGALRFDEPGVRSYEIHTKEIRTIHITQKYELMIRSGELVYLARTAESGAKEVLLQKEIQEHKLAFALKDIVDRMEGYQDKIIRLPYFGKLTITGPAGSGKTTLALHRIAYLKLIPLYEKIFNHGTSLIVVKDEQSQEYFKELLPNLGIKFSTIETYGSLGKKLLSIPESVSIIHDPETEFIKSTVIRPEIVSSTKSPFSILSEIYKDHPRLLEALEIQKKKKVLDYADVAHLLHVESKKKQGIFVSKSFTTIRSGKEVRSTTSSKVTYDIILVDEFQNYSLHELTALDTLVDAKTESIMYIGDIHQTIYTKGVGLQEKYKSLHHPDRHIHVGVSYRNTKEIIEYIHMRGHNTMNASPKRSGSNVIETVSHSPDETIQYIQNFITSKTSAVHAVIAPTEEIAKVKKLCIETEFCKLLTYEESQGFEFESTLVILHSEFPTTEITKNLEYIALTRAMNGMEVLKI